MKRIGIIILVKLMVWVTLGSTQTIDTEKETTVLFSSGTVPSNKRGVIISSVTSVTDTQRIRISFPLITSFNLEVGSSSVWNKLSLGVGVGFGVWGWRQANLWGIIFPDGTYANTINFLLNYRHGFWGLSLETIYAQGEMRNGGWGSHAFYPVYYVEAFNIKYLKLLNFTLIPLFYLKKNSYLGVGIKYYHHFLDIERFYDDYKIHSLNNKILNSNGIGIQLTMELETKIIYLKKNSYLGVGIEYYHHFLDIERFYDDYKIHSLNNKILNSNGIGVQLVIKKENKIFQRMPFIWAITYKYYKNIVEEFNINTSGLFITVETRMGG